VRSDSRLTLDPGLIGSRVDTRLTLEPGLVPDCSRVDRAWSQRLKQKSDEQFSTFALNLNLRRYTTAGPRRRAATAQDPDCLLMVSSRATGPGKGFHSSTSQLNLSHIGR